MLKGIPSLLSPELLKILMEMGHGDEIVIGDGNFPAASCAQRLVRCDGHGVPEVLEAILQLMPLDPYVEQPLALMDLSGGDTEIPPIWQVYADTAARYEQITMPSKKWNGSLSMNGPKRPMPLRPAKAPFTPTSS